MLLVPEDLVALEDDHPTMYCVESALPSTGDLTVQVEIVGAVGEFAIKLSENAGLCTHLATSVQF